METEGILRLEEGTVLFEEGLDVLPRSQRQHGDVDVLREAFRRLLALGFTEAFRAVNPNRTDYTFWDYQAGAWNKNDGIRIDHVLLTPQAADRLTACDIDVHVRGGPKPSDHAPIWVELDI